MFSGTLVGSFKIFPGVSSITCIHQASFLSALCFAKAPCEVSPFHHMLKSILHVQVPMRCLQRRVGQVQMGTPTLCATTWAGPFPACPQSSLPTSGLPAKSRSLSVASWTCRQDSFSSDCTSAPQYCLVCATPAFAQDQLDFYVDVGLSVGYRRQGLQYAVIACSVWGTQSTYSTSVSSAAEFAPSVHQQPLHGS